MNGERTTLAHPTRRVPVVDDSGATELARRIQTGTIGVNHYLPDPAAPFGGVKGSGLGRELGPEGLAGYQQLQCIYLPAPTEG